MRGSAFPPLPEEGASSTAPIESVSAEELNAAQVCPLHGFKTSPCVRMLLHNCQMRPACLQGLDAGVEQVGMERSQNERPDLGSARVVISGRFLVHRGAGLHSE